MIRARILAIQFETFSIFLQGKNQNFRHFSVQKEYEFGQTSTLKSFHVMPALSKKNVHLVFWNLDSICKAGRTQARAMRHLDVSQITVSLNNVLFPDSPNM